MTDVYSYGLCYLSVCTDESDDDLVALVNKTHPSGIEHGWVISEDSTFRMEC